MATFVLIPSGWQGGWVYGPLAEILAARGHAAVPVTLPGLGDVPHPVANRDDQIGAVADIMRPLGGELVLVGHSYAGMVVSGAAEAAPSSVQALVYVDAYVPEDGESCWSLTTMRFREMFIASARADGRPCALLPGMDPRCRPHPMGTFLQSIRLRGRWRDVPRKVHVGAFGWDGRPFHDLHRRLSSDPEWTTHAFSCGHNVARLQPEALADVLLAQV